MADDIDRTDDAGNPQPADDQTRPDLTDPVDAAVGDQAVPDPGFEGNLSAAADQAPVEPAQPSVDDEAGELPAAPVDPALAAETVAAPPADDSPPEPTDQGSIDLSQQEIGAAEDQEKLAALQEPSVASSLAGAEAKAAGGLGCLIAGLLLAVCVVLVAL